MRLYSFVRAAIAWVEEQPRIPQVSRNACKRNRPIVERMQTNYAFFYIRYVYQPTHKTDNRNLGRLSVEKKCKEIGGTKPREQAMLTKKRAAKYACGRPETPNETKNPKRSSNGNLSLPTTSEQSDMKFLPGTNVRLRREYAPPTI